jgi:hypothetical protein
MTAIVLVGGACVQRGVIVPKQTNDAPAPSQAPDFVAIAKTSDLVFVGTVLERGAPPGFWSGRVPAYQTLKYRVDDVLKGSVEHEEVAIDHLVVGGTATAEPGDVPALSASLFAVGSRVLVFAVSANERWVGWNDVCGAVPYDAEVVARVRAALHD